MKKENISLIVGLALPVILVVLIAGALWIPRASADPQYDFVYLVDGNHYVDECTVFTIIDGTFVIKDKVVRPSPEKYTEIDRLFQQQKCFTDDVVFYVHDVSENVSKEISLEELQKIKLDDARVSPDGFTLMGRYRDNGIFDIFGGRGGYETYLEKDGVRLVMNIVGYEGYYFEGEVFHAWISKETEI